MIAAAVAIVNFLGFNEIFSILTGGIFGDLFLYISEKDDKLNSFSPFILFSFLSSFPLLLSADKAEAPLIKLFLVFLKIGVVWFGSGYNLVAYFDGEFVQGLNWLTRKELLDAIAVGQFTPGPFLSSATFIGYQISEIPGAILATIGISIPSFIFILILNPLIPLIRQSKYLSNFLDAAKVSAVAVMFVVAIKLGAEVLIDWKAVTITVLRAAAFLTIKKINLAYIVLGGSVLGYVLYLIS